MHATIPHELIDSAGRRLELGQEIGRGGEGIVLAVSNQPDFVAKVYHKVPLPAGRVAKLQALTNRFSKALMSTSAWPMSVVYSAATGEPCGLMMPRVSDSRQLHELYSTITRRRYFPDARWHHLVLAARNLAAAFESLHNHGVVVGDVNQGNLLVDKRMCVRFIDCDSFQISNGTAVFRCPVATPHFTPPEIQSANLKRIERTVNHDAFGLAVLIFHLLFVGRHPFAGRFRGSGDLSIEEAIEQQRFAFSHDTAGTQMEPPPASLMLDDIPASLAGMFELALRSAGQRSRPRPRQWVEELEILIKQRISCGFDKSHVHYRRLTRCPWCRIEGNGGPQFFLAFDWTSAPTDEDLHEIEQLIRQTSEITFPDFTVRELRIPEVESPHRVFSWRKFSAADFAAVMWIVGCALCLVGIGNFKVLMVGVLVTLGTGVYVVASKECRSRRRRFLDLQPQLRKLRNQLNGTIRSIGAAYATHEKEFEHAETTVRQGIADYRAKGEPLFNAIRKISRAERSARMRNYLQQISIRENCRSIRGVSANTVAMLESYGVESALEIEPRLLSGIPSVSPSVTMELIHWRAEIEKQFVHKPDIALELNDVDYSDPATIQRFRFLLARKVLADAKRLRAVANTTEEEVESARASFSAIVEQKKRLDDELQLIRKPGFGWAHIFTQSPMIVAWVTIGIPLACILFFILLL